MLAFMGDTLKLIWWIVIGPFRSRTSLEAEILYVKETAHLLSVRRSDPSHYYLLVINQGIEERQAGDIQRGFHAQCGGAVDCYPLASCWLSFVLAAEVHAVAPGLPLEQKVAPSGAGESQNLSSSFA